MATHAHTTRRSLFAIAGAATLLPPSALEMPEADHTWRDLIASVVGMHPNAPAALRRALDHGVDPRTFSGVALAGPREDHLPALFFGDRQASYTMVLPGEVHEVRRFH